MFHIDVLSAYLNCGVSALVGAAMLRTAETDDPRLRAALRTCGRAMVMLGIGLLPAGLGQGAWHPLAQFSLGCGSLLGVLTMSHGLSQLQGREVALRSVLAWQGGTALAIGASVAMGPQILGWVYAAGLAGATTLMSWQGRGYIASPRDVIERSMGISLALVALSSWLRLGFTLAYQGPPRPDMLYVPAAFEPVLAALYGVMPFAIATLLLSLVNARLHQQLRRRATTDELTGLLSRRALREFAPTMIELERTHQRQLTVLMLDFDHFKLINDSHGHATGDQVLKVAATTLQRQLRHDALLARYGGEEFVAVVPVDDLPSARRAAERLRLAVESVDWKQAVGLEQPVTVSVGAALLGPGEPLDEALRRADEALYRAKRDGRNQVQVSLMAA